jgi:GNAT superfamily N-acetyltransferase
MADVVVRAPNGDLVEVPEAEYQKALNAGYQNVPQEEADAARSEFVSAEGEQAAVSAGMMSAPDAAFSPAREALAKGVSAATFGLGGLNDPTSRLTGQRFQTEYPGSALAAEVAGQLPLAIATGGVGEGLVAGAAGATRLARAGVAAADFGVQAAVGGAQTEAEAARLEGREFSATNAAVAGLVGEAFGRTAGVGFSKAIGASRNLIARTEQRAVAQDASDALTRGGFLNDFRVAAHADQYQNELARLAADDLDALETGFAEVSRQDRKRARITRVVEDHPAEQAAVRAETLGEMQSLYEALYAEVGTGTAPGPAKRMLDQLRERMDLLAEKPTGARLWRTLDENRQALQDYAQDLHQAYETAPGSAWLSREALQRLDASERVTRETLLREDVWGTAAAREQAAYNVPFNEKYFPTAKTVRGKLMFSTATDARGFPVFRGDPAKVRSFFGRGVDDVDASRLSEQFREYLDGVEAIARAGERDTPKAARDTLEAVRRLRKAQAHAEFIQATSARMGRRADVAEVGVGVAAGVAGAASGGLAGAAAGGIAAQTVRGLRTVHWLSQAARKLGWAGSPESMAAMLGRDALPTRFGPDVPVNYIDDLVVGGRGPSEPPSGGPGAPPTAPADGDGPGGGPRLSVVPGGAGRGLTPSMRADAARGSWAPSEPPRGGPTAPPGGPATAADDLAEPDTMPSLDDLRPGRAERAARPTRYAGGEREVGRGQAEVLETDPLREAGLAGRREAARIEALSEGEFREVVRELKAAGTDEADEMAEEMLARHDELVSGGLVRESELPSPAGWDAADAGRRAPPPLDEVDDFYRRRAARASTSPPVVASPAAQAATQAFTELGVDIRMGGDRLAETLDTVFGTGKAPTPEQWRQIIPLETLKQIGPVEKARIDVLGDSFIWSAEGVEGMTGPFREWDGYMNAGGYTDNAWKISRTFSRDDAGRLEVHHDNFFVRGDLQGTGVGAQVLKSMMEAYRKIGVDVVTVDSVEVGKYFWPSIGFNHPDKAVIDQAVTRYAAWLERQGKLTESPGALAEARRVRSLPALAQTEFGKEFLLTQAGPWNFGLRLDLGDDSPMAHLMRGRLDIAAAGLATLGAGALEKDSGRGGAGAGDEDAPAQAGMGPMAGFAAASALFNRSSARLVANAAKRLFSLTAEPVVKATARLAYSRPQIEARRAELTEWHQNPDAPGGLIERLAEGLRDAPPDAFAATSAASYRALGFLRSRLPQSGKAAPIAANRGIPVSAEAAMKYARYEQAALQPGDAIREASESGHLSAELLETLEELYPELLAELRVAAYQAVQDAGPRQLSIQAKTQYARLFDGQGELADPTFSANATRAYAAAYEQVAAVSPPKAPNLSGPHVSATAQAVASPQPWRTA